MKITYVYADRPYEWNTSEWRCAMPARAINRSGVHTAFLVDLFDFERDSAEARGFLDQSDIVLVERNLRTTVLTAIQRLKAQGKPVAANFDDAYHLMTPDNPSYPYWFQGKTFSVNEKGERIEGRIDPVPLTQFKWGLRMVDAITVPSKVLMQDWQDYAEAYLVPNYIDLTNYLTAERKPHDGVVIGWGGSLSHLQSFTDSGVLEGLRRVLQARSQVKVMICGDKRVYDHVDLPEDRKIFQGFVPFSEWPGVVVNFDIGLAPLQGAYDERRSWIKPLEYMVLKVPWAASEGPAYEDIRGYGVLVQNTAEAWEQTLLDMVDRIEAYRERAAGEPYQFGMAQGVDNNVDKIVATYQEIIDKAQGG